MRTNTARATSKLEPKTQECSASSHAGEIEPGAAGGAIGQIVGSALSLKRRGGIGRDGLVVRSLSARLRVQLLARSIHPWDRDRPADERGELFVQQCLEDVSIAIPQLFRSMPEIQEMEITILDPKGKSAIMAGVVKRGDALAAKGISAGMMLREMGMIYGRSNAGFEQMEEKSRVDFQCPVAGASAGSAAGAIWFDRVAIFRARERDCKAAMRGNRAKGRKRISDMGAVLTAKLSVHGARPSAPHDSLRGNLELDPAFCWQAVYSRDHRFDGLFFAGIASTGVYCRPICPVSFGHPESVHWFQSAAAAEAAGFRPCRRCRPDTAPGSSAWYGTWAVVSRALKLISEGALDGGNLESLAERVGIGSRHLRRLFQRHLGASPLKIARSHRVLVARNLIAQTQLPIAEIAKGTGFRSIRQFNHSVRTAFGKSPTALRRLHRTPAVRDPLGGIVVHLPYRPPFDWPSLIQFFKGSCDSRRGICGRRNLSQDDRNRRRGGSDRGVA